MARNRALQLFVFCVFFSTTVALAQRDKAVEYSRRGYADEQQNKLSEALYNYNQAIAADAKYPYPYERIGAMYQKIRNYPLAIKFYSQSIALDSAFDVYNFYNLGLSYRVLRKHDSAATAFAYFISHIVPISAQDSQYVREADFWVKFNLQSLAELAKPALGPLPDTLWESRSNYDDFAPSMTADAQTLYFTSRRPSSNIRQYYETHDYGDDLFVLHRDSTGKRWTAATPLNPPLNSVDDEGSAFVSADGQTLYLSLCRRPDGSGDCDIYISELISGNWTPPVNLGHAVNSSAWDAQPSVSADGSSLYFSSKRPGSIDGSEDIWVCYRNLGGTWSKPINLGEPINTQFSERSPFIAADGKTLYFSSNGLPGHGNHDLFLSRHLDDGSWTEPINLGSPINSFGDDVFLTVPARGDRIFYASQRGDAKAPLHIYETELPQEFRPGPITVVAGRVYDQQTKVSVAARIEVTDLNKGELTAVYNSNPLTGKFYIPLGTGKEYGFTAKAPGYAFYSGNYTVPDTIPFKEVYHDLPLVKIPSLAGTDVPVTNKPARPKVEPGTRTVEKPIDTAKLPSVVLNNLFFNFNEASLRAESKPELKNLLTLLAENPKVRIRIVGYTDSVGSDSFNLALSKARAETVRSYLLQQGVSRSRLSAVGLGETNPVATNKTDEGRQQNRRVEFEFVLKP